MARTDGIVIKVGTQYDGKDLARAQRELDKLQQSVKPAGAAFSRVGDQIQKAGQRMSAFGSTLTRNVTLPLAAVAAGAVVAINKASDLSETISKVGVLFGDSAGEIEAWSKTSATALGQSQQQALDAASTFAIFGQSAGLQGQKLVDFSTNLTTLATDLASFNNTSPDEAIQAIGAALRGEAEPLRRYGVLLDDATLKAAAMAMGIYDGEGALTAQQKVLAANKVIFEQTSTAQGDFARTSDGLANQSRILKAQLEDVTTQIGTALLPIALELVGVFRDKVIPVIERAADWFASLPPDTIKMGAALAAVAAAAGPAMMVMGSMVGHVGMLVSALGPVVSALGTGGLAGAFTALGGPVAIIIAAIAGVVAIVVALWRESQAFRDGVVAAWETIKAAVVEAVDSVKQSLEDNKDAIDILKGAFQMLGDFLAAYIVPLIRDYLVKSIKGMAIVIGLAISALGKMIQFLRDTAVVGAASLAELVRAFGGAVNNILGQIALLLRAGATAFSWIPGVGDALRSAADTFDSWRATSVGAINQVADNMDALGAAIIANTQPRTVDVTVRATGPSWVMQQTGASDGGGATARSTSPTVTASPASGSDSAPRVPPFKAFVDGLRESVAQLKAKAQLIARGVPEALADSIVNANGWRKISARLLKGGQAALQRFVRLWAQSAAGRDVIKSQVDLAVQAAKDGLQRLRDLADQYVTEVRTFGSATSLGTDAPLSATSISANLRQRLGIVRQFIAAMGQLKSLGLDASVRSDIFALGPFDGLKYAQALIEGGRQAIGEVNMLTRQFNSASVAGQFASIGTELTTSASANYASPQSVTVAVGGINITVNGSVDAQTREQIRQAVVEGLTTVTREARSSRKAGVR